MLNTIQFVPKMGSMVLFLPATQVVNVRSTSMVLRSFSIVPALNRIKRFGLSAPKLLSVKFLFRQNETLPISGGVAKSGNCKVDCYSKFYIFLTILCLLKFSGATGRASNFLVTVR